MTKRRLWIGAAALIALAAFATTALSASARPGTITTVAGTGESGFSGDGGPATKAQFDSVTGITFDAKGDLYIADAEDGRVRKVDTSGIITTFAGSGVEGTGGDGGPATGAQMSAPYDVAVDQKGNVYIPDAWEHRVRKVDPNGVITTFAGNGSSSYSGDGGPAAQAGIPDVDFVVIDRKGNVYVGSEHRVRKIDTNGIITTFAGTGVGGFSGDGGPAARAQLSNPNGMAFDAKGNLYIADHGNERIRKVSPAGIITTVAGSGREGYGGDGGPARKAAFRGVDDVAVDSKGNIYATDFANSRVRRISPSGIITTFAGNGKTGYSGDGGPATKATLYFTDAVAIGPKGNIYISDYQNARIRMIVAGTPPKKKGRPAKPKPGSGIGGACNRATAVKLAVKHAYGEPFGHPQLAFICGHFTGADSTAMAAIYHSGTCLPSQGFAVFHRVGGVWKQVLPLTDFGALSIKAVGNDIKETAPVFKPGDPRCIPSGGDHSRVWRWNGSRMVAGPWTS